MIDFAAKLYHKVRVAIFLVGRKHFKDSASCLHNANRELCGRSCNSKWQASNAWVRVCVSLLPSEQTAADAAHDATPAVIGIAVFVNAATVCTKPESSD